MKNIILVLFVLLITTNSYAGRCKSLENQIISVNGHVSIQEVEAYYYYQRFSNIEDAKIFAKGQNVEDNVLHDVTTGTYLVFLKTPTSFCVSFEEK